MTKEEMKARTKKYALRVIKAVQTLPENRVANILGGQLLRAGTSVGANYRAACRAKSLADFVNKLKIVEEESDESLFWMELLVESGIMTQRKLGELMKEGGEILAMVVAALKTTRGVPLTMTSKPANFYETQVIAHLRSLRGQAVILDSDLAWFLGIEPTKIITAVEDNPEAFPEDFVFRLTCPELVELQRGTPCLTDGGLSAKQGRLAFTTHGAGMLLVVIKDEKFSLAAIPVFRAFGNFWKANEDCLTTKPLVNRKS